MEKPDAKIHEFWPSTYHISMRSLTVAAAFRTRLRLYIWHRITSFKHCQLLRLQRARILVFGQADHLRRGRSASGDLICNPQFQEHYRQPVVAADTGGVRLGMSSERRIELPAGEQVLRQSMALVFRPRMFRDRACHQQSPPDKCKALRLPKKDHLN